MQNQAEGIRELQEGTSNINYRAIRSIMFTPATRIDRFCRAIELGTDICLLDCEDSVGSHDKEKARSMLCNYLAETSVRVKPIAVRINPIHTKDGMADLMALSKNSKKPDLVVIPKTETQKEVLTVEQLLKCKEENIKLIALVETLDGVQNIDEIASSSSSICALMFGAADFTNSIDGEICWDTLLYPRTMIVYAAKKNNLGAIDTPYFSITDTEGLKKDCNRVKMLGFTGRCVIHPQQVSTINEIFSCLTLSLEQAERIIDAARKTKGNICQVDGKMIGAPLIQQALSRLGLKSL